MARREPGCLALTRALPLDGEGQGEAMPHVISPQWRIASCHDAADGPGRRSERERDGGDERATTRRGTKPQSGITSAGIVVLEGECVEALREGSAEPEPRQPGRGSKRIASGATRRARGERDGDEGRQQSR